MSRNHTPGTTVALLVIVVLVSVSGAWAQSSYKTLYRFKAGKDAQSPHAGLIFDTAGNLYGTTLEGGAQGAGAVFKLTRNSDGTWTETVIYSFCLDSPQCGAGRNPVAGLTSDGTGNLYGTTWHGGAGGGGVVFRLTPNPGGTWALSVLHSFCTVGPGCADGDEPLAGVIFDAVGNLYGTTSAGGVYGPGTVFELMPKSDGSWEEKVLHSFCSVETCPGGGGGGPEARLVFDATGSLYGTTNAGGADYVGTVFELTQSRDGKWHEKVLYSFCSFCCNGSNPQAGLILDAAGNLYGTTTNGGEAGGGIVFKLTQTSGGRWKETVLHSFCTGDCGDGYIPGGEVTSDAAGNLYGTTVGGGNLGFCPLAGCGVVYKLTPQSSGKWKETTLHVFIDRPAAYPLGSLVFDASGNLYGTAAVDGESNFGSVFEITP